jgi:hypothetical protein
MTCKEFERLLETEVNEEHLSACAACRELVEEMRANSEAMLAFSADALPSVSSAVMAEIRGRRAPRWGWIAVAAAMLLLTAGLSRMLRVEEIPPPPVRVAVTAPVIDVPPLAPVPAVKHRRSTPPAPVLMVKMLTSDPDVVIYWSIEPKEGTE